MLCLKSKSQDAWLQQAIDHTDEVLVDHAHCERKAATQALSMLARYPDKPQLVAPMLALAREELEHFELVLAILQQRNVPMVVQSPTGYQGPRLFKLVRSGHPDKLVDLLLIGALIEARSCERFKLLADHHPDPALAAAFRGLLESEARHHATFVRLAETVQDRVTVRERLAVLAEAERSILEDLPPMARVHA